MSLRPPSSAARPGTRSSVPPGTASRPPAGVVPPGTASRLATGQSRAPPTGSGVALAANIQVQDRPMTRQGLGLKTAGQGPKRQVQDKTFFLGKLRSKVNELSAEIEKLHKEKTKLEDDQQNYVSYEKRAENMASELKRLQDELGDYNTMVDKLNTDASMVDIQMEVNELRAQNDHDTSSLDQIFEKKKDLEKEYDQLQIELNQMSGLSDAMVADMNPKMRERYFNLKNENEHLLQQIEKDRHEMDNLEMKKQQLEQELQSSPFKQEAVRLTEHLHEIESKRDQLIDEQKQKKSPQEEREELLSQVKTDNQEIASMERQIKELQEKNTLQEEEMNQLNIDLEENQGERNQKYKELRKREATFDEFLNSFEENKKQEEEKIVGLERSIVALLEHISRNLARSHHLPTPGELSTMRSDLTFKESEMKKSEYTASGLASETQKLQEDLMKVEQLEAKISQEFEQLKDKNSTMEEELVMYSDLEKLKKDAEKKKKTLSEDKVVLHKRKDIMKRTVQSLTTQYEGLKAKVNENETYSQLANLEKKWQHYEQNNFVMREFIAAKSAESNYKECTKKVLAMISTYNTILQNQASGKTSY